MSFANRMHPRNLGEFIIRSIVVRNRNRDAKFKEMQEKIRKHFCAICDYYEECKSCGARYCGERHSDHVSEHGYCSECFPEGAKKCDYCPRA